MWNTEANKVNLVLGQHYEYIYNKLQAVSSKSNCFLYSFFDRNEKRMYLLN
jgi:hypothetical protein